MRRQLCTPCYLIANLELWQSQPKMVQQIMEKIRSFWDFDYGNMKLEWACVGCSPVDWTARPTGVVTEARYFNVPLCRLMAHVRRALSFSFRLGETRGCASCLPLTILPEPVLLAVLLLYPL
jgi:hypothetical protein